MILKERKKGAEFSGLSREAIVGCLHQGSELIAGNLRQSLEVEA
jgi:hypothetical protein